MGRDEVRETVGREFCLARRQDVFRGDTRTQESTVKSCECQMRVNVDLVVSCLSLPLKGF